MLPVQSSDGEKLELVEGLHWFVLGKDAVESVFVECVRMLARRAQHQEICYKFEPIAECERETMTDRQC